MTCSRSTRGSVLGLEALAEFFIEGLPAILASYQDGFSQAWQAGYDSVTADTLHPGMDQSFRLNAASQRIADGHVAMVMLLLSAIVAYLLRGRGDMRALADRARSGRLGERFAQWLTRHEEQLRQHPRLQERSARPTGAAGGGTPPPPPRPPRRGRDEPEERGGPRRMPPKEVRCFGTEGLPESKMPEFNRQLGGQERGINEMSVDEYLRGRKAFDDKTVTRNPQVARKARASFETDLTQSTFKRLQSEGKTPLEAGQEAAETVSKTMATLAALHNPDMVVAGKDRITRFGDRNVNSRIGAQWRGGKGSRLFELDEAARGIPDRERALTRMNAKLKRC